MRYDADYWIRQLQLTRHVEGGSFSEVYRSALTVAKPHLPGTFHGNRNISTAIYFLLESGQFSAFHRIASDELWHFYTGDALDIYEIDASSGKLTIHQLGPDPEKGQSFQTTITAGNWFASRVAAVGDYALTGCTVAPGFDFADFELAERAMLTAQYPEYGELIKGLTR
jgi:predicted cupin superfamily sugar epimerase